MNWLEQLLYWHWWILGIALLILETLAPGAFFLWMGISAGVVGLLLFLFPATPWEIQLLVFAVGSVAAVVLWRHYRKDHEIQSDVPNLNRRGEQYVGRVFHLDAPIVNGFGKLHVDDSTWKIEGDDCPTGTKVKVVGVDGVILKVAAQSE